MTSMETKWKKVLMMVVAAVVMTGVDRLYAIFYLVFFLASEETSSIFLFIFGRVNLIIWLSVCLYFLFQPLLQIFIRVPLYKGTDSELMLTINDQQKYIGPNTISNVRWVLLRS